MNNDMSTVIKVIAVGNGAAFNQPVWIENYDVDAPPAADGFVSVHDDHAVISSPLGGRITLTTDHANARRFPSMAEAFEAWNTVSTMRPTRPDGEPNKPLTALTVEIESAR